MVCTRDINAAAGIVRDMAMNPDQPALSSYKLEFDQKAVAIEKTLQVLGSRFAGEQVRAEKYKSIINGWLEAEYRAIAVIESGNVSKAQEFLLNDNRVAFTEAIEAVALFADDTVKFSDGESGIVGGVISLDKNSIIVVVLSIIAVLCSIVIAVVMTKSIVAPLAEVQKAASAMAAGNLKSTITYSAEDEVGRLAEGMRSSMAALLNYIKDIDRAVGEMSNGNFDLSASQPFVGDFKNIEDSITKFIINFSDTLAQIGEIAQQVSQNAEQVSTESQELAAGAAEQASTVQTLSAVMAEISETIRKNAVNAAIVDKKALEVGSELIKSEEQMQNLIKAMAEISQTSEEIKKIISNINDIAFQTDILALNAAVEAAHAGASGKGVAVVADEVRMLAGKSAKAVQVTTTLIQNEIRAVENGLKLLDVTAQSLGEVQSGAQEITLLIDEIALASDQQAVAVSQVVLNVEQISDVVQTNAALAEESAAASQELSGQAQTRKDHVDQFNLKSY